jgi:hypothetical protein
VLSGKKQLSGKKTRHRRHVFGIFCLLIRSRASPPEAMADEYSFLPNQTFTAVLIAPPLRNSKHYTTEVLSTCGSSVAIYACSLGIVRRVVKSRYLATDGIG